MEQIKNELDLPKTGEVYRHYKGGIYYILHTSMNKSDHYDGETDVIYETEDGQWANRPLREFLEIVTVDGQEIPRFAKENGTVWESEV